ncbi:MAG: nucleotidyl transferase [Bacteroidetes bacterium]|nr:nucleotidyl transferase [Bacteroidota bacterium]MCB0845132.1 nucleotidyl transferase [Bacteroidota bacterium]
MKIRKAVITAAARGARLYPVADTVQKAMLPVVDKDGLTKPVIQIIAEEAFAAGVEEISIVCAPGDEARYVEAFTTLRTNLLEAYRREAWAETEAKHIEELLDRLSFSVQEEQKGYGHAVLCTHKFVDDEPFLLLLGDHLYTSHLAEMRCAQQLIHADAETQKSISAVSRTPGHLIKKYGTLSGRHLPHSNGLYQVEKIIEKPDITRAELELQTAGLKDGYFLCIFGMHILQPAIFEVLGKQLSNQKQSELLLTPALQVLAEEGEYLAKEIAGNRFDLSSGYGLFQAQLALGLAGEGKDEILTNIVELLSESKRRS